MEVMKIQGVFRQYNTKHTNKELNHPVLNVSVFFFFFFAFLTDTLLTKKRSIVNSVSMNEKLLTHRSHFQTNQRSVGKRFIITFQLVFRFFYYIILAVLKVQSHLSFPSEISQAKSSHFKRNYSSNLFCVRVKKFLICISLVFKLFTRICCILM